VAVADTSGSRGLYGFDAKVAHPARVYDYWLGGKDNFEADRIAGEETIAAYPAIRASARANRAFLDRSTRFLAGQAGIRQFIDLGTGLPTASNTPRWPSPSRRRAASSTSTTTRWCCPTPGRC
jgi:hypothetical protein